MKFTLFGILFLVFMGCNSNSNKMNKTQATTFYVGTYTDGDSEGIYKYQLLADGTMKKIGLAAEIVNPSYLAFSNNKDYLLAVSEVDEAGQGFVQSFKIEKDSLVMLSKSKSGGAHPCFVSVNKAGVVAAANYTGGNIGFLELNENGQLSELLLVEQHEGNGSHSRQEAPHAHSVYFTSDTEVVSADLGTNQLWFSTVDLKGDTKKVCTETFDLNEEAGPRHLALHTNGKWLYVLNELDNTVSLLVKNTQGKYHLSNSFSTLPNEFTAYNTCADIHFSPDGKFLYTSNRGHNSIAIFQVLETGELNLIGHENTHGNTPRNFMLSPNGQFLLVANQDSNNIVSFKRNEATGLLDFVAEIEAPKPVCLLF